MIPHLKSAKGLKLFSSHARMQHPLRIGRVGFGHLTIGLSLLIFISTFWLHPVFGAGASAANLSFTTENFTQSPTLLGPGEVAERDLSGGTAHRYRFSLPAGHYLRLTVEQRAMDVVTTLLGANGEKLLVADYAGKQSLSVIAATGSEKPVTYQIELRARLRGQTGRYLVRIEEQRPAIPRDANRVKAERLIAEANEVGRQNGQAGLRQSVEKYRLTLPLWRAFPVQRSDQSAEARTLYLMALRQQDLGEHQAALDSYLQSLELSRSIRDEEREHLTLSALGTLYFDLGDKRKAIDCYNAALNFSRSRLDRPNEAAALVNLGVAYKAFGENSKAMECYQQALTVARALGDQELEAASLTNLARLHDLVGERMIAANYYQQSLPLWRALGNAGGEAVALKNMGALAEATGKREDALGFYRQALSLIQTTGDVTREAHIHGDLARVERDLGNFSGSRNEIEKALAIFDSQRQQMFNPDLRASFAATNQRYYEFYVDLLMRQNDHRSAAKLGEQAGAEDYMATAFQVSEGSKARALADLIAEARIDLRDGIPSALLERESDLAQRLTIKKAERVALTRKKAPETELNAVAQEIVNLNLAYEQVQSEIKRTNPRYVSLTRPSPIGLSEVQSRLLDDDSVLLEFALGEERSYVWAISKNSVKAAVLPARAEIEEQAFRFYDLLTARSQVVKFEKPSQKQQRIQQADRDLNQAASALSCTLLNPVAELLSQKKLLVVGDGMLNYIPFGALPEPVSNDWPPVVGKTVISNRPPATNHRQPLLVKHEVINLPSATVLAELRRDPQLRRQSTHELAIIADPVFNPSDDRLALSRVPSNKELAVNQPVKHSPIPESAPQSLAASLENVLRNVSERDAGELTRLPFSRQEAVKIASLAAENKRLVALDFQANRSLVVGDALNPYRYIHFATHGLLNSQSPELSGLVLSLVNDQGESQLGVLRLGDIYKLKLSADLVVLSACRTGLGKEVRGEGVMGLTRGFMHAGIPRVIASLWSVDDAATSELMTRFYRELLTGKQSPAAALRAAQISMWKGKQWQSPFYWAAFTLQGEPK
ncbi:MAG: CHAT domain-containing tetratricopeptide repeat protein [Acidobacteriota bacterium]|nr:CHAT domain-containing tetratricopeptide repeat protein [Acidobacteriota bacterium]